MSDDYFEGRSFSSPSYFETGKYASGYRHPVDYRSAVHDKPSKFEQTPKDLDKKDKVAVTKKDDWNCSKEGCKEVNFAYRNFCRKCNAAKPLIVSNNWHLAKIEEELSTKKLPAVSELLAQIASLTQRLEEEKKQRIESEKRLEIELKKQALLLESFHCQLNHASMDKSQLLSVVIDGNDNNPLFKPIPFLQQFYDGRDYGKMTIDGKLYTGTLFYFNVPIHLRSQIMEYHTLEMPDTLLKIKTMKELAE